MVKKPELIVFSQYKIGGVQSFYHNILSNDPYDAFDIKWIFVDSEGYEDPRPLQQYDIHNEVVFKINENETVYSVAGRLQKLISKEPGVVVTNFETELMTIHLYRRKRKCVFFICHDQLYVDTAKKYAFLIDKFITHNEFFYEQLQIVLPDRVKDIFYRPYGVAIPKVSRQTNLKANLKIVIAARLQIQKGVRDIPVIDTLLREKNIRIEWTIIGDGLEKENLQKEMLPRGNCQFFTVATNEQVRDILVENDIFILPSRLDGLPVALLEAMSVGCVPVVAVFNEGIKKVVTEDIGYVLPIGANDAFAEAIEFLHYNRSILELKSINAKNKIVAEYDIKQRAREYFDLFLKYKNYKKTFKFRISNYGGLLHHPSLPVFVRWPLLKIKRIFK